MKRQLIALTGTVWLLIVMVVGWGGVRAADPALDTAWRELVAEYGLSWDAAEEWVTDILGRALLDAT